MLKSRRIFLPGYRTGRERNLPRRNRTGLWIEQTRRRVHGAAIRLMNFPAAA